MRLTVLPGRYAVCRLPPEEPPPLWALEGRFVSITRTANEWSMICPETAAPADAKHEAGWRIMELEGPFAFTLTGILAAILNPLAEAQIGIFAMSTFDTDYVLVKEERLEAAIAALRQAGHDVGDGDEPSPA